MIVMSHVHHAQVIVVHVLLLLHLHSVGMVLVMEENHVPLVQEIVDRVM